MPTTNSWNTPDLIANGQVLIGRAGNRPLAANITSTGNTLSITNGAGTIDLETLAVLQTDSGFATWGGAGNYFDDTTLGSFTILRPGTGYINGVPISWAAPQTVTGMGAGTTYYIYIDSAGLIQKATSHTVSLYQNNVVLFECLRDSTAPTNNQLTVKENHPYNFPVAASEYDHRVIGSVIQNNNNGANITLNGTQKIQINGADVLEDHGLETTIPDSAGVGVTWNKYYTNAGGLWARYNVTDTFSGTYNNAGTPTALAAGRFGVYTLYVSKDNLNSTTPVYIAVLNTSQYPSLVLANNAISTGSVSQATNELKNLEIAQLGYIIYSQGSNSIVSVIISKSTLKQTLSTSGTNTASLVNTNVTNFNGVLSAADTNVQAALETIDECLGTGSTSSSVTIGNVVGASSVNINTGTGGSALTTTNGTFGLITGTGAINIGADAAAKTITIGNGTGATSVVVNCGTGALDIGTNTFARTTTLGNTTGASVLALKYGTGDFTLASATGTTISALDTGEVTYPLQPGFSAYLASVDSNVTGNGAVYTLGTNVAFTEIFDTNSDFNTNGTFTAPVTGKYLLLAQVGFTDISAATSFNVFIVTTARSYRAIINRPAYVGDVVMNCIALADMAAGDTAKVQVEVSGEVSNRIDILDGATLITYFSGNLQQ